MDDWFSFREIAFQDRDCIIWLASHIETLEAGEWPQPPIGRRMTDGPISLTPMPKDPPLTRHRQPMRGQEARFVKPESIAAEFRRRLELVTGSERADADRVLFEEHCMSGVETYRLARVTRRPEWWVNHRIFKVLRFMAGKGLKYMNGQPMTYAQWLGQHWPTAKRPNAVKSKAN